MPTTKTRVNVTLGDRLAKATKRAGLRRGLTASAFVRSSLVERLLADGDITDAELEADERDEGPPSDPE